MQDAAPLLFLFVALVVFWLLVMRPARSQQRKVQQVQSELEVGHEVVLSSGIFGTIRGLTESRAEIEVAPGTVITVARQVVVRRVEDLADDGADDRADDRAEDRAGEPADESTPPGQA